MRKQQGFTLVEMLVVMGIIAVLIGALVAGFSRMTKTAQKAKAQETVSNAATALASILTNEGRWPKAISDQSGKQMNEAVAKALAKRSLMSVTHEEDKADGTKDYTPAGVDKYGILDPWGAAVLKRNLKNPKTNLKVPSGRTVADHLLWFAVDKDGDGVITTAEGAPVNVRASAIVWCAGADGELGTYGTHSKAGSDDIYSWSRGQEQKK